MMTWESYAVAFCAQAKQDFCVYRAVAEVVV